MAEEKIEIINSKLNLPIIQVEHEGHMLPIHSKYNPIAEAERLIDSYAEQIEQSDHILFYGVGLGYHVQVAQKRYPEKLISTYEPIAAVHEQCIKHAKDIGLQLNKMSNQYVGQTKEEIVRNLSHFKRYLAQHVVILVQPVYGKIAQASFQQFSKTFQQFIQNVRTNTQAKLVFNDRWLINMMMNIQATFETPNILQQPHHPFQGKPMLLVAAGPSLTEELDNIRKIKENGVAFIFAVGSANEVLIKNNIYPDVVTAYDPSFENYQVYLEIIKQNIQTIPLIFGTTVGHDTVAMFPGPQLHMVMNRDLFTPYLHDEQYETINDSTTVATVTLQLAGKLQVSQVILVGQNLAYKKGEFYAKGIHYYDDEKYIQSVLQKIESGEILYVEDVHGNQTQTEQSYDEMRREMEMYIENMPHVQVINTTQGGAKIAGTVFNSLQEVMKTNLTERVVDENWWGQLEWLNEVIPDKLLNQLEKASVEYRVLFQEMMELLGRILKNNGSTNSKQLNQMLDKMYKLLSKLTKNTLFHLIIEPIINVHTERFYSNVTKCQKVRDNSEKMKMVYKIYSEYMLVTLDAYRNMNPILQMKLIAKWKHYQHMHYYEATSGAISYQGNWQKNWFLRKELNGEISSYGVMAKTMQQGATLSFKFTGTSLQLIGVNTVKAALKLKIKIDHQEKIVSIFEQVDEKFTEFHHQVLFETSKLSEGMHKVTVEIMSNDVHFNLMGVRIQKEGRLYHVDEVEDVANLTVGKRIRCHYEASYNQLGEFSRLGEASGEFLPLQAMSNPNGDFYFTMIDENKEGKICIAERVIQNRISSAVIVAKQMQLGAHHATISLLTSATNLENSEWDYYLACPAHMQRDSLHWNADTFSASWVENLDNKHGEQALLRGSYIGEDGSINLDEGFDYRVECSATETFAMNGYRPKIVIREGK